MGIGAAAELEVALAAGVGSGVDIEYCTFGAARAGVSTTRGKRRIREYMTMVYPPVSVSALMDSYLFFSDFMLLIAGLLVCCPGIKPGK